MKAMIFAAGLGTRLKPLTDTMPKALVPVGGKPLLYHVICKLRDAGYDSLVVNVHHFPKQIKQYLAHNDFGLPISISDESGMLLETGAPCFTPGNCCFPPMSPSWCITWISCLPWIWRGSAHRRGLTRLQAFL